ncbi:MAG: DUF421 domain-containing protein [Fimbriimonadaceae bacterium]|nr:DUF421 domain-containing protein [Fimbriimonadaceae bacterium]QYK56734.1 MAG: DUF421 domain-containing protein [Fimbriimonadaceae bacterium]
MRWITTISVPWWEHVLHGTVIYLGLLIVFRFISKRESGSVGRSDILLMVLVAESVSDPLQGESKTAADGLILASTIVGWATLLDYLSYRFKFVRRLVQSPPTLLVQDGKPLGRNLRREFISPEELESQLRLQGIDDIAKVKRAYMESNGEVSVVPVR